MIKRLFAGLFTEAETAQAKPSREPRTHDFTKSNQGRGHSIGWRLATPDGHRLSAYGWGSGLENGDYLLLSNGPNVARYQVTDLDYMVDPKDQFFCTLVYAPRQRGEA